MVKHIVLYTLKEGVDKTEAVKLIASVLEPLVGKIPGLLHLEIRQAFNGMDYALYSEFESREALALSNGVSCLSVTIASRAALEARRQTPISSNARGESEEPI